MTGTFSDRPSLSLRLIALVTVSVTLLQGCHPLATIERRRCTLLPWSSSSSSSSTTFGWSLEERGPEKGSLKVTVGWGNKDCDDSSDSLKVELPTVVDTDSLAASLWPPGAAGAILFQSPMVRRNLLQGKSVLELGCGLGLAGLVAADAAASCHLTDNDQTLIDLLQELVSSCEHERKVKVSFLDWRDKTHSADVPKADIIIGTDIAYYFFLLRYLMDTTKALLKPQDSTVLIVGQANRESQWDLYHNLLDGSYNQLTDEREEPWAGSTEMILYRLEMSTWYGVDSTDYEEGKEVVLQEIDGVVPIAVLLHQTSGVENDCHLTDYDYIATKQDEEEMEMTF